MFYFRRHRESLDDATDADEEGARLAAYQDRIRSAGVQISEFRDPSLLGELIYDDLIKIIKRDFADAKPPTALEEERSRHEAFSLSRRRAYIPNPAYLKRLNDFVEGLGVRDEGLGKELEEQVPSLRPNPQPLNPALIVYAESGSGKSSLFAFWAEQYRRKHPEAHVIEHYVGIGATATDHYAVIRHICMEINERFGRDEEIPSESEKLELALGQWLGYADHELSKRGERMVLILDGLNQLQGTALGLKWIPDVISPSIRLIVSSTVEGTLMELQNRGWLRFGMQALSEAERETIVVRYLAEYHKSLNPEQIKRLATDYKCGHPLFLKTVLEELRLVSRHEELDAKIESYLEATGTEDLFQLVLERMEEDYNMRAVRDVMSLLSASRNGLDERELSELSGIARLKIATMMAGLDYHLVRKEGCLTFFHDYLRRAVEKRYLSDQAKQRSTHLQLAEYFQSGVTAAIAGRRSVQLRMAGELAYQLHAVGAVDRLCECLSTMPVFMTMYSGKTAYEVSRYWSAIADGRDVEAYYRRGLGRWGAEDGIERNAGLRKVSALLQSLGFLSGAIDLQRERLASSIAHGDRNEEASSRLMLGGQLAARGMYAEAVEETSRALELYTELEQRGGVAAANGNLGLWYVSRGEYNQALERFQRQFDIYDELGDRKGLVTARDYLGVLYTTLGEYDRALEGLELSLRAYEESGNNAGVAITNGNMGSVYAWRGEHDRALERHQRALNGWLELGDRRGIAGAIGSIGIAYFDRGEYDRALEHLEKSLSLAEDMGYRSDVANTLQNIGYVYADLGEYERAIETYQRSLDISMELGERAAAARTTGAIGVAYSRSGQYDLALETLSHAEGEDRAIGRDISLSQWLQEIAELLLRIVVSEEQSGPAEDVPEYLRTYLPEASVGTWRAMTLTRARELAEECAAIGERLKVASRIFGGQVLLARIEAAEGRRDVASQRLTSMLENAADDEQRAELRYWLWSVSRTEDDPDEVGSRQRAEENYAEALRFYRELVEKAPKHIYRRRIEELQAAKGQA